MNEATTAAFITIIFTCIITRIIQETTIATASQLSEVVETSEEASSIGIAFESACSQKRETSGDQR